MTPIALVNFIVVLQSFEVACSNFFLIIASLAVNPLLHLSFFVSSTVMIIQMHLDNTIYNQPWFVRDELIIWGKNSGSGRVDEDGDSEEEWFKITN